jgi:hypothetical protein
METELKIHGIAIVNIVESELEESRPCPLCLMYTGGHQAHCPYLFFWSWKTQAKIISLTTPEESPDGSSPSSRFQSSDADVVSADEASLPSSKKKKE